MTLSTPHRSAALTPTFSIATAITRCSTLLMRIPRAFSTSTPAATSSALFEDHAVGALWDFFATSLGSYCVCVRSNVKETPNESAPDSDMWSVGAGHGTHAVGRCFA